MAGSIFKPDIKYIVSYIDAMLSIQGHFLLVKQNGKRKPVVVAFQRVFPPVISWGTESSKQRKLTEIKDVHMLQVNGKSSRI